MLRPTTSSLRKVEELILTKCAFLARAHIWPHTDAINPRQWLRNFDTNEEKEVAYQLLDSFMYFPERMTRGLMRGAVQRVISEILDFTSSPIESKLLWERTVANLVVLPVRGENSNSTDSGLQYTRLFRNTFGLPEGQFPTIQSLLLTLLAPSETGIPKTVLFVDDFVGSGDQFITDWQEEHTFDYGLSLSLESLAQSSGAAFYYCPLLATAYGIANIQRVCGPHVQICPAHVIPDEYNALHPNSRVWSNEDIRLAAPTVLRSVANRIGMPDTNGASVDDWQGYHKLGLGIALHDSMPDACLGVFRFKSAAWKPLFNKSV